MLNVRLEVEFHKKTFTLEAETSVSRYTQCDVFLALTKRYAFQSELLLKGPSV